MKCSKKMLLVPHTRSSRAGMHVPVISCMSSSLLSVCPSVSCASALCMTVFQCDKPQSTLRNINTGRMNRQSARGFWERICSCSQSPILNHHLSNILNICLSYLSFISNRVPGEWVLNPRNEVEFVHFRFPRLKVYCFFEWVILEIMSAVVHVLFYDIKYANTPYPT